MNDRVEKTLKALENNNMKSFYAEKKEDIIPIIEKLIKKGDSVAFGGSVTLDSIDAVNLIRKGDYTIIDRYAEGISPEERKKRFRDAFFADVFLTSSNAVTVNGDLINVDGVGNRVAAMIYGPDNVIIVAGVNKIVDSIEEGFDRIKKTSAPKNCNRLGISSYCSKAGQCMGLLQKEHTVTSGCKGENRICCDYTVMAYQRSKDRIKVIICGEELGY